MALPSDLQMLLSGGAGNTNSLQSLGGVISNTPLTSSLFDNVSNVEAASGDTEYRCIYLRNGSAETLTLNRIYISMLTPSEHTEVDIGLGTAGIDGEEQTVDNEDTAPVGVDFFRPTNLSTGLLIPQLDAGEFHALWIRRTVDPNADPAGDGFKIRWSAQVSGVTPTEVHSYFGSGYFGAAYFG